MKYLTYKDFVEKLSKENQERFLVGGTSVRPDDALQKIITGIQPKVVLEIGTGFGTSAIAIASCSTVKKVITFDIKKSIWPGYLAEKFNLQEKILYLSAAQQEIHTMIKALKFDLAYIDGAHIPPYTEADFEAVKHCGQVLLDDAYSNYIRGIVAVNGAFMISNRFAYWNAERDYKKAQKISAAIKSIDQVKDGKLIHSYTYLKNH